MRRSGCSRSRAPRTQCPIVWIGREIQQCLALLAGQRPAVVLTGSRQSGKTSLLTRVFPQHRYVSLDIPAVAEAAELSGEAFLSQHAPPVIIDEIQYAPALLRHIKADIDRHREQNGRCPTHGVAEVLADAGCDGESRGPSGGG